MLERRDDLAKFMTEEQGKPIRMARGEVGYAADFLSWFAEEAKRSSPASLAGLRLPLSKWDLKFSSMPRCAFSAWRRTKPRIGHGARISVVSVRRVPWADGAMR